MSGRPRTGRGATTRDTGKESDLEADLLARIVEGVKKAKEHNDESQRLGQEIMSLEGEIKAVGCKFPQPSRMFCSLTQVRLDARATSST